MRISVGIGTRLLTSEDGGESWTEGTREVPWRAVPRVRGLPAQGSSGPCDVEGRAPRRRTGGRRARRRLRAHGVEGQERAGVPRALPADARWRPILAAGPSSPVHPGADPRRLRLASREGRLRRRPGRWDAGVRLGGSLDLRRTPFAPRALGGRRALALPPSSRRLHVDRVGSGTAAGHGRQCDRHPRRADGCDLAAGPPRLAQLPAGYDGGPSILHETHFLSAHEGLALSVDWHEHGLFPPIVGLARTVDGGRQWRVSRTWEGPTLGDPNERHVLTLEVIP
jgi:hypothetical protein